MLDQLADIDLAWREGLRPERQMSVSYWADHNRMLPKTAAEPGLWRTSRAPFLKEIMDELSTGSSFERVVFMKGTQIGGTECGLNWLGYIIDNAPGLAMLVMPTSDTAKRNSGVRIDPMIEDCPALKAKVVPPSSKEPGNSIFRKKFPGGELVMVGANSAAALRSTPARYLMLDEVDNYPGDVDDEGDPVDLAIKRTATFVGKRKIFLVSSPKLKGFSRIETAYNESDKRIFEVPCLSCGEFDIIKWSQIKWDDGKRKDAYRECDKCGFKHQEHMKPKLFSNGKWRATAEGDGKTAGFWISGLYSPWATWGECALEHLAVHKDPSRLQTFINTVLAETWELKEGLELSSELLLEKRESTGQHVNSKVVIITAGIDVQDDRIEVTKTGWGAGEECWILEHHVLWGDPSADDVWNDLDDVLSMMYSHSLQVSDLPVKAACLDTGHFTQQCYEWAKSKQKRRFWAIKGVGNTGQPLWPRAPSLNNNKKIPVFNINGEAGKEVLYSRISGISESGSGYIHFPDSVDDHYLRGLVSEKVRTVYSKGRPKKEWFLPRGNRNEPLDCWVYAYAALQGLKSQGLNLEKATASMASIPAKPISIVTDESSQDFITRQNIASDFQASKGRRIRSRGIAWP